MEYKIKGYEPARLFQNFEDFSAVPRGSGFEKEASDFLVSFAENLGLEVFQDPYWNVIVKKPGSKGADDLPPVIFQGHIDMVCEKVHGCDHDFHKEGIDMYVTEDGWLTANGTTLGGDDGIADAIMMTLLEDDTLVHPPLECVFTVDEEVGLLGANKLDYSRLEGRRMINLDSEDEGIVTVSCAGGMDYKLLKTLVREEKSGYKVTVLLKGLLGGHSGTDIDLGRANADKLLARALNRVLDDPDAQLLQFQGGTKDNAIPREDEAEVLLPTLEQAQKAEELLNHYGDLFYAEVHTVEPDIETVVTAPEACTAKVLSRKDSEDLVHAVLLSPNGVQRRDPNMDNFVLTSLNLGVLKTDEDRAMIWFAPRSSVDSLMEAVTDELALTAKTFGFETEVSGAYPGWEKVENSELCETMKRSYRSLFGEELKVEGIHAGLECGLFYANLPGLDPVSIGPTMRGVHTPDEKMDLSSCERTYRFVVDVLAKLAE
ncbi:MAG: aminoacyl-histidine dipeptidase [Clostridia bacterium]|nr:aminoacyl-histidine dipeptidase [Clostridia bacterium]